MQFSEFRRKARRRAVWETLKMMPCAIKSQWIIIYNRFLAAMYRAYNTNPDIKWR